jgi:iron complex transport system ATP-binding protein
MSLTAEHVSYVYRRRGAAPIQALDDVSITIPTGSFMGLIGPNGCGKSTLLRLLAGIARPAQGHVRLDGRDVASYARREYARRVAVVPQETHPAFDYSVMDMVLMGRHPHLGPFELEGPADLEAAMRALEATHVNHLVDRPFNALSGGEKQRVVIASALAQAGDVLLLDEPTASLDLGAQLDVAGLLRRLHRERGATTVMATHDLNLAASLCDTLVLLRTGRVLAHGATDAVLTAANVRELYGVEAEVRMNEQAAHLTVVALRRTAATEEHPR